MGYIMVKFNQMVKTMSLNQTTITIRKNQLKNAGARQLALGQKYLEMSDV